MDVAGLKHRACPKSAGALDDIFQFAHVAGPVKLHEHAQRFRGYAGERLSRLLRKTREKKFGQAGDVFLVIAQRRNIDRHDIQAVVEVLAERAFFERRAQVAIRGGDQAHIHFDGARAAEPLEFALLQNAQQLHLRGRRHIADFVEKKRAFVGQFEFAGLAGCRAGERAFLVAEEFALEKIFGNGGAVDFDERAGGAAGRW